MRYVDLDYCGTPSVNVDRTAQADCLGPAITNVLAINVTDSAATITWDTDEPANQRVVYDPTTPPGTVVEDLGTYGTAHALNLYGLQPCTEYFFEVTSVDIAGNPTTDNNGSVWFSFTTLGRQFSLGPDDVESGPGGWTVSGSGTTPWHIDDCRASSPTRAWKAGAAQGTCPGQYDNNVATYLTSAPFDLGASGHGYHLRFSEYVSTESGWDFCYVQISDDGGGSWSTLDQYSGPGSGWVQKDYDLAAYSGNVEIRFYFDSDGSVLAEGWYVDDIDVSRPRACGADLTEKTVILTDGCAVGGGGSGDGIVDPGEDVVLELLAENTGLGDATSITGVLSTPTPGVTVTDASADFPNLAAGASGSSLAPHFSFTVGTSVACGTLIDFTVDFTAAEGAWSDTFQVVVGQGGSAVTTYDSTDVPKAISDLTTITSVINVADTALVTDVDVQIDITHTYDSDLDIFLIAPNGTRVELTTDNGGGGDNFSGTIFDDEASTPVTAGVAPFTGSYQPEGSLATVDGIPANGVWTLEIYDDANLDQGTLNDWSVILETDVPLVCNGCTLSPPPEVTPLMWTAGSKSQLEWPAAAGAVWYDVYRGDPADLPNLANGNPDSCLRWLGTALDTGPTVTENPAPGTFYWFLVRGANGAGEGPAGSGRTQDSSGNCP